MAVTDASRLSRDVRQLDSLLGELGRTRLTVVMADLGRSVSARDLLAGIRPGRRQRSRSIAPTT
ncbi:hypothetical protein MOTC310_17850 [Methylobacterium oryzae]|uniref:Resolvase/invertase-type recombinase catalytic domain-containing protein n=1 Tax=Methylobacterium oryzae TaxID=334852 RepID=A0ABU7TRK6_9HYPH